jgi:hypothetical protein
MESGRVNAVAQWTGKQLLLWGGQTALDPKGGTVAAVPAHGLAYDPSANRWATLPPAPILGRIDPPSVSTGSELIVWGGDAVACGKNGQCTTRHFRDGAAFRPG